MAFRNYKPIMILIIILGGLSDCNAMHACIVFIFAVLMEYTGILLKMKLRKLYSC
jgi:hypothetical protein